MKGRLLDVLIVDDAVPIRQELRMMDWNAFGAVLVGESPNGKEALEFCREYTPDVVITDIKMPVMDGLELFRCLKQEFSSIQVIVLTCYSEFNYAKEALSLGAVDYIVKVLMKDEDFEKSLQKAREAIEREELFKKHQQEELGLNLPQKSSMRIEVREAIKIINENIEFPITLSYISSKVALSPFYLGKIFSEEVGKSFNDYVTEIRMEKAVELLQSTNLKVYEVAEKVGIPNYRYFSNLFRNWTGQTPKEYKRGR